MEKPLIPSGLTIPDLPVYASPTTMPFYLDSSMVNAFRSCPRKFHYNYQHHFQSPGKSIHLVAGGAFAAGLEAARLRAFDKALPEATHDDIIEAAFDPFCREWGDFEHCEDREGPQKGKSFSRVFHALEEYLSQHPPLADDIQPVIFPDGKPAVEFSFAIPLLDLPSHPSGTPFVYVGRFDLLGLWGNEVVVLDEKTTSALGQTWLQQWDLRSQFLGYAWACQQLGHPVHMCFVRGIGLLITKPTFLTAPVRYSQALIDKWYNQLGRTIHHMLRVYETGFWDQNFGDSCSAYGGCSYKPICASAIESQWFGTYEARPWNPIKQTDEAPLVPEASNVQQYSTTEGDPASEQSDVLPALSI